MKTEVGAYKVERAKSELSRKERNMRYAVGVLSMPDVIPCIRKFGGKVVNKRFFDALAVATGKPPEDLYDGRVHTFGKINPYRCTNGSYSRVYVKDPSGFGQDVSGFEIVTDESGRLDAEATVSRLTDSLAAMRKALEVNWREQLDGLVEGLNRIGEQIDALKEKYDTDLWYDLNVERWLILC